MMSYDKSVKARVIGSEVMVVLAPKDTELLGRIYLRGLGSQGPYTVIPGPANSRSFSKGRWLTRRHNDKSRRNSISR